MALKFVSHREIAFRNLLGMLRAPPFAMMNYYSNLFLSARFVFGEFPDKLRYLDKEVRKVECMVGLMQNSETLPIKEQLRSLQQQRMVIENKMQRIEPLFEAAQRIDEQGSVQQLYDEMVQQVRQIDEQEHQLIFRLTPTMNLKMIETYMDNNYDLKSYFKESGRKVTQLEIAGELDRLKRWVYMEAVEMMPYVRFTKME